MLATPSFTGGYPQINPFGVGTLGDARYPQFHWGLSTDQPLRGWYLEQLIEVTPWFYLKNSLVKFPISIFWKDIPQFLAFGENIARILLFLLMAVMPLRLTTRTQKAGLALYGFGTLVYFGSWLTLMHPISSECPSSAIGFLAPAYTPILWLTGIGLIGDSFAFNMRYRRVYFFGVALVFLGFHVAHAWLVFGRMH